MRPLVALHKFTDSPTAQRVQLVGTVPKPLSHYYWCRHYNRKPLDTSTLYKAADLYSVSSKYYKKGLCSKGGGGGGALPFRQQQPLGHSVQLSQLDRVRVAEEAGASISHREQWHNTWAGQCNWCVRVVARGLP